ncbi:hypothetical protein [Nonomuraea sp. SYSU D8015]|nr:hypothetical protein [Nonomuraea sp. SYSU D8015]
MTAFRTSKTSLITSTSTSWQPTLVITVPASAVSGTYTGSHSVA